MGPLWSKENTDIAVAVANSAAQAIATYLEPSASEDEFFMEHYVDYKVSAIDLISKDVNKFNTAKNGMADLDIASLVEKALNSKEARVFKYSWEHQEGGKKGRLKFFCLRVHNKDLVANEQDKKVDISVCIGIRSFKLSSGDWPQKAS